MRERGRERERERCFIAIQRGKCCDFPKFSQQPTCPTAEQRQLQVLQHRASSTVFVMKDQLSLISNPSQMNTFTTYKMEKNH